MQCVNAYRRVIVNVYEIAVVVVVIIRADAAPYASCPVDAK